MSGLSSIIALHIFMFAMAIYKLIFLGPTIGFHGMLYLTLGAKIASFNSHKILFVFWSTLS
jgi:hypothetical protein